MKRGQRSSSSIATASQFVVRRLPCAGGSLSSSGVSSMPKIACTSRATPRIESRSARFEVTSSSITSWKSGTRARQRLARPPALAEHHDALALLRDVELALGEDHAVGGLAAQLRAPDLAAVEQRRARQRDGDGVARAEVPGAAHDLARRALPHVDLRELQAVGVRVLAGLEHVPGDDQLLDAVDRGQAAALDALDLVAREREARDELVERRQRAAEVIGQPLHRHLHRTAPLNCSRKRTSLS